MKTFFNIFFVWPIKIVLFLMIVGAVLMFAFILFYKLGSIGKDVRAVKERMFNV